MTTMTTEDAIKAAASVARDVADGKLPVPDLQTQAVTELRQLFGAVVGEGDACWELQLDAARQVLAAGGIPADELAEWLAVARHRAGEPLDSPDPDMAPPEPDTAASAALSPGNTPELVDSDLPADVEPDPQPKLAVVTPPTAPPRPADGEYDPLAHWPASRTLPRS